MGIWFIERSDERISDKKLLSMGNKRWHLYKKMRPVERILVNLQDHSVIWKIAQKPYFITLSPAFLGPEGTLE